MESTLSTSVMLRQYRRMLRFLWPYSRRFALLFLLSVLSTAVTLALPYLTKLLIDDALVRHNMHSLWYLAALMGTCAVSSFALGFITTRSYTALSARILFDMREELFERLQHLTPSYFARTKTGDIVSRLNGDIGELQRLSSDTLLSLPSNLLFLIGSAAAMAALDVKMFLIGVALTPLGFWAMRHYQQNLRVSAKSLREQSADIGSFLIEAIMSLRLIVCSNAQRRKNQEFKDKNNQFLSGLLKLQLTSFLAGALPSMVLALSTSLLFLVGGSMVIRGVLSIGGLMAFMAYYSRLLSPVQSFMGTYSSLIMGSVSLQRVLELFDVPIAVQDPEKPVQLRSINGCMELRSVSFAFGDRPVLSNVSFVTPARSISLLVGTTGAGKSTIIDLLLRFYDPDSGQVFIDDDNLRDLRLQDLRQTIAVVEQTPFLFHSSIRQNLTFVAPDAHDIEIENALGAAQVWDFVDSLPERLDTIVGERGLALSAGQRQRLAIARALLRKPSILILDEPSSALDPTAEHLLAQTLRSIAKTISILVVTHRPALLKVAEHVIVLEDGQIVEQGSPEVLRSVESALNRHFLESVVNV